MAALATLATTLLVNPVASSDSSVQLTSLDGVLPGLCLYADRELMIVVSLGLGTSVNVLRGQSGTASTPHASQSVVTIGRGDQFYDTNPAGLPVQPVLVSPWINVLSGEQWFYQGDETGANAGAAYWQRTLHTRGIGSLGVRTDSTGQATTTVS